MDRLTHIVVIVLLLLTNGAGAETEATSVGRPLIDVLAKLQQDGLRIVYSSAVVDPSMVVIEESRGDDPREILAQILAPHGLKAEDGPGGTILIVVDPLAGGSTSDFGTVQGQRQGAAIRDRDPRSAAGIRSCACMVPSGRSSRWAPDFPECCR